MTNPIHDDPRLTAYALGELEGNERRDVERLLAESPAARDAVDAIRGIAVELTAHLRAEPMPALTSVQRSAVMSGPQSSQPSRPARQPITRGGNLAVISAACLMLLAAGWLLAVNEKERRSGTASRGESLTTVDRSSSMDGRPVSDADRANDVRSPMPIAADTPGNAAGRPTIVSETARRIAIASTGPASPGGSKSGSKSGRKAKPAPTRFSIASPSGNLPALNPYSRGGGITGLAASSSNQQAGAPLEATPSYYQPGSYYKSLSGAAGRKGATYLGIGGREYAAGWNKNWSYLPKSEVLRKSGRIHSLKEVRLGTRFHPYGDGLLRLSQKPGDDLGLFDRSFKTGKPGRQGQQQAGQGSVNGVKQNDRSPRSRPAADIAGPTPAAKQEVKPPKQPAVEWFAAKDVKAVRENVVQRFDYLAKQHPKRELAILRVKTRLSDRLQGLERQVALAERQGQRIPAVEGRVILGEAVRQEVRTLDVDGDGRADFGGEGFDAIVENSFLTPLANPLSTFSIDVDTASYSNVRRYLDAGALPPRNAVRVEEFVNYFRYDYPQPTTSAHPFSVTLEGGVCPWNTKHRLVLIGLKGREIPHDKRPPANLVFLIDVSGSMQSANRLPLVKLGLEMLVDQLRGKDRVSIVTYSNTARTVLEPTAGDKRDELLKAIHSLNAAGSTNGSAGIQMAYDQAQKAFAKTGSNRVILCTDGDFNVGVSSDDALVKLIQEKAKSKVFLSVFGFGMGNTKHAKLEKIADKGNGHYAYIDKFQEAKKVFVEEMSGTLYTIAKDVKIQVEFNPAKVASYRLVGYENRMLAAQDFNDDKKDAGEIGAGHTVTALYEIVPVDAKSGKPDVDDLKYQRRVVADKTKPVTQELLTVKLRYKQPTGDKSTKIEFPLKDDATKKAPSQNFDFASAVAMYGLLLRDSKYAGEASLELVRELAAGAMGKDPEGRRSEFVKLVQKTESFVANKLGKPIAAGRPGRK